jgi:UDP-N-acetyl-D-mannosaminuronic acid dehydrogenase
MSIDHQINGELTKVVIMGLGYIGLPAAAIIASRGVKVLGVDIDPNVVESICQGKIHIVEPDLDIIFNAVITTGNFRASTTPEPADVFIIAVPTPLEEDKKPNCNHIYSAVKAIAPLLEKGNLIILESTSPVGTTEQTAVWLSELRPDLSFPSNSQTSPDILIAYCPERVLPGNVLQEMIDNDRIIGGMNPLCGEKARDFYLLFVKGKCVLTDTRTAEMSKLTENAFRDVNIAFANEISMICDPLNIDVWELIKLSNLHPRVNILQPGPDVGGHCIAVDPWFVVDSAPDVAKLIKTAREVNDSKPNFIVKKVLEKAKKFKSPVIACLGLAFKPDIDDLRESPALEVVKELATKEIGKLLLVEPNIDALPTNFASIPGVEFVETSEAISQADIIVLLVHHRSFFDVDLDSLQEKIVIDTRGIWK